MFNLVRRLRLGSAVLKRLQIENDLRSMWTDLHPPGTKRRSKIISQPFSLMLRGLTRKGYVSAEDCKIIEREYRRLSLIIHGGK